MCLNSRKVKGITPRSLAEANAAVLGEIEDDELARRICSLYSRSEGVIKSWRYLHDPLNPIDESTRMAVFRDQLLTVAALLEEVVVMEAMLRHLMKEADVKTVEALEDQPAILLHEEGHKDRVLSRDCQRLLEEAR